MLLMIDFSVLCFPRRLVGQSGKDFRRKCEFYEGVKKRGRGRIARMNRGSSYLCRGYLWKYWDNF